MENFLPDLPEDHKFEYWYWAKVTDIYDGDSITLEVDLGLFISMRERKIRFMHINAPELRGEERPQGLVSKGALESRIPVGTWLKINTYMDRSGKYGRLLAIIYLDRENINGWLYRNGYAVPYIG